MFPATVAARQRRGFEGAFPGAPFFSFPTEETMHMKILACLLLSCFLAACATNPSDTPPDNKSTTSSGGAAPRMPTPMGGGRY